MAQIKKINATVGIMWVVFDGVRNGWRINAKGFYNEADALTELARRNS